MKEFQKIIKYASIAFGLYLAVSIIGGIVAIVVSIFTGIYGVNYLTNNLQDALKSNDSNVEIIDENQELEQFSKMKLEISTANLTVKSEGNSYRVEKYQIPKNTKIESKDGVLEIKNEKIFNKNDSKSSITVYIPENVELDDVAIEIGAGTVNIAEIKAKNVDFDFGAGNVELENISVNNNTKIQCGAGQVIIKKSELTNANIDAGVGKLSYLGELKGNSKISCGVGSVQLDLIGDSDMYEIHAEKGIGDIKIDDVSVADNSTTGNGENKINIEGGVGSVDIKLHG